MNDITIKASSSNTYSKDNKHFYKDSQEYKIYSEPKMDVDQLQFFKEHTLDETKLLIFKILRKLPTDVHLPILTILDQYEEWLITETLAAESTYSSSELSDPEEEYERRLIKQFSSNWHWWYGDSSGNETD